MRSLILTPLRLRPSRALPSGLAELSYAPARTER
jgi:hypothetical protein